MADARSDNLGLGDAAPAPEAAARGAGRRRKLLRGLRPRYRWARRAWRRVPPGLRLLVALTAAPFLMTAALTMLAAGLYAAAPTPNAPLSEEVAATAWALFQGFFFMTVFGAAPISYVLMRFGFCARRFFAVGGGAIGVGFVLFGLLQDHPVTTPRFMTGIAFGAMLMLIVRWIAAFRRARLIADDADVDA